MLPAKLGGFRRIMGSYQTKQMAVQQEIKSYLAKLLATEDIVVEHRQVSTAQFDVRSRVLTLPMWEKARQLYMICWSPTSAVIVYSHLMRMLELRS